MLGSRLLACVCGIMLLLTVADGAHGQTIRGRVSDSATGRSVPTVLVRLVDVSGESRTSVAADSAGRYEITAPEAGRYRQTLLALSARALGLSVRPPAGSPGFLGRHAGLVTRLRVLEQDDRNDEYEKKQCRDSCGDGPVAVVEKLAP